MSNTLSTAPSDCSTFVVPAGYEFVKKLGEGGHGIVILARRTSMDDLVAIKILKSFNQSTILRFRHEAGSVGRLNHENVARALLFAVDEKCGPFIVYEYVQGQTLKDLLAAETKLSLSDFESIFDQLLRALACAHNVGVIHRDIKPSNIMLLRSEGEITVKLLDFGIAKDAESTIPSLTQTNEIVGTPEYMSPEQCQSQTLDFRSDLYSTACVMYECLTGRPPISGENPMHCLYRQIQDVPQSLSTRSRELGVPAAVCRLIDVCLSKEAANRPESADKMRVLLHDALSQHVKREVKSELCLSKRCIVATVAVAFVPLMATLWFSCRSPEVQLTHAKGLSRRVKIGSPEQWLKELARERADLLRPNDFSNVHEVRNALIDEASSLEEKFDKGPRAGNALLCAASLLKCSLLRENHRPLEVAQEARKAMECCFINGRYSRRAVEVLFNEISACVELGQLSVARKKVDQAIELLESAPADDCRLEMPKDLFLMSLGGMAGKLYCWRAQLESATDSRKALADFMLARKYLSSMHIDGWRVEMETELSIVLIKLGQQKQAIDNVLTIERELDEQSAELASTRTYLAYKHLARFWIRVKNSDRAIALSEKALAQLSSFPSEHAERQQLVDFLTSAYKERGSTYCSFRLSQLRAAHPRFPELHGV